MIMILTWGKVKTTLEFQQAAFAQAMRSKQEQGK
jgi:hypothetical protein